MAFSNTDPVPGVYRKAFRRRLTRLGRWGVKYDESQNESD
jgi:hypothetical protein